MELKHNASLHFPQRLRLLIVPYGIETNISTTFSGKTALLIVPYGIETAIVLGTFFVYVLF